MKRVYDFLALLAQNNNRVWFNDHKQEYLQAHELFNTFTQELIHQIGAFDPTVRMLTLKDCTYRIYRDVRFSKDKAPYKTHMGAYICRGGKKSGYSGYYFHIAPHVGGWGGDPFLAVGDYINDPKMLRVLREDIVDEAIDIRSIMQPLTKKNYFFPDYCLLKKVPRDFPADHPYADYLKVKLWCLSRDLNDELIIQSDPLTLAHQVALLFKPGKPFLDMINNAVDYLRDDQTAQNM